MASSELYSTEPHFYGRFEARVRFAPGDGVVSSFFLWKEGSSEANAYWNELDFEKVGANCEMHTNAYYGKPGVQHTQTNAMPADICAGYHTYAFEWTPTYISWSVDGKEFRRETGATATSFAQNATGGMTIHFNLWPGNSSFGGNISKTTLPVREYISWVQYSAYDNGTFKAPSRQEFDGSSVPSGWAVGNWASPFNLSTHNPQNVSFVDGIAVMSLTNDNATGNPGTPPADPAAGAAGAGGTPSTGGSGGAGGSKGGNGGTSSSGGTPSSGGTAGSAGATSSGGTTSGSGGTAATGGALATGGVTSSGGSAPQGGASGGTQGGGNAAGGSTNSGNGGSSAPTGGNSTTGGSNGGGSDTGNKAGGSSGCSMTRAQHGAGTATCGLILGALAIGVVRRARRRNGGSRRSGIMTWLGLSAALLVAGTSAAEAAKPYRGAEVFSRQTVLYGRAEVRMRMVRGSGIVSSFFTYKDGSEKAGATWEESDIEILGKNDAKNWQSNLVTGNPRKSSEEVYNVSTSLAADYHTYALEWTPGYVAWYLDGTLVRKTEGGQAADLVNPETLRFNVWSSTSAGWVGTLDESALPAYQFVNWIKFYRYENGAFTLDWTDEFNSFDSSRWGKGNWTFDGNQVDFDPANAVVQDGTLILALTKEGATGFSGTVPVDSGNTTPTTVSTKDKDSGGCSVAHAGGSQGGAGLLGLLLAGFAAAIVSGRRKK